MGGRAAHLPGCSSGGRGSRGGADEKRPSPLNWEEPDVKEAEAVEVGATDALEGQPVEDGNDTYLFPLALHAYLVPLFVMI